MGWLVRGLLKAAYLRPDGREAVKAFAREGDFVCPPAYFLQAGAGDNDDGFFFEALEPTTLATLTFAKLRTFYDRHPSWERVGRKIAEHAYLLKVRRERHFLLASTAERYEAFVRDFPGLRDRVPQYLIAAFLGVTPVALSRVVNRKARKR